MKLQRLKVADISLGILLTKKPVPYDAECYAQLLVCDRHATFSAFEIVYMCVYDRNNKLQINKKNLTFLDSRKIPIVKQILFLLKVILLAPF